MVKKEYRDNKIVNYITKEEKEQIIEKPKKLKCTVAQLIRFSVFNLVQISQIQLILNG